MLYEAFLLFAVAIAASFLFAIALQQKHALELRHGLQVWLFLVMGFYFIWFWTHGGQTLAMKTWHIRLVAEDGKNLKTSRAIGRYVLGWLWVLPGLVWALQLEDKNWITQLLPVTLNLVLWSLTAFLDPDRRFLHDRLAGTRLIHVPPPPRKAQSGKAG